MTYLLLAKSCLEVEPSLRTSSKRSINEMYARSTVTSKYKKPHCIVRRHEISKRDSRTYDARVELSTVVVFLLVDNSIIYSKFCF